MHGHNILGRKMAEQRSQPAGGAPIELRDVSKRYGSGERTITALDRVTLDLGAGRLLAVTGPSGSGKSTLLHLLGAMDRADSGTIRVGDTELTALSRSAQVAYRRRIGFVFQRFHLLPALTALDNVAAPLLPVRTSFDKHERARALLEAVGLAGREHALPAELSGGQQQRVAIARALVGNPILLLADEPSGNLDTRTGGAILDLLLELRAEHGMTVVLATHDPVLASRCERIVRLLDGRVLDDVSIRKGEDDDELLERIGRIEP
jgi:putative ABC transport system ATP-binding protein